MAVVVSAVPAAEYIGSAPPTLDQLKGKVIVLVIADRRGIVRLYHPGRMTEDELETQIRGLLGSGSDVAK